MTDTALWNAVVARDTRADGTFVYAVRSTRIYCRPSCPSRKPGRAGVLFFPTPAIAAAEGYRACRRCHPDVGTKAVAETATVDARVRIACEAVARRPDARWTVDAMARAAGASVPQLQRAFRRVLGIAPRDYVAACRRRSFLDALRNGHRVTDAVYESGYGSPSRVYEGWTLPGMTPATYGRGGSGARLRWLTTPSEVGRILVGATDRGVCFVAIGDDDAALVRSLEREFPRATVGTAPSPELAPVADVARAAAAGTPPAAAWREMPDVFGTAFQWRVWRALTKIPAGETRSYAQVARAIGRPGSARAVARACATNPLALLVPCHRVVPATGASSGGYRWGSQVKQQIIARESAKGGRVVPKEGRVFRPGPRLGPV